MSSELDILERFVRRVEEAAERIEDRVNVLERETAAQNERIKTLCKQLEAQNTRLDDMTKTMGNWKSGAAILFGLGAASMWALDHLSAIKKFFLGQFP